jgi:AcrR family transcriptional regulator
MRAGWSSSRESRGFGRRKKYCDRTPNQVSGFGLAAIDPRGPGRARRYRSDLRQRQNILISIAYRSECYILELMPRGTTKRRPITISALLDAAMDLFAKQGYGATSVQDICDRAGLTKGAFYSNFSNKDALFLALLDRSWERRAESIRRALPLGIVLQAGGVEEKLSPPQLEAERVWTLVSTEFSLHAIRHNDVATLLVEHELRVRSELAVLMTEALQRAGRRPTLPIDQLACMIVAVTEGSRIQVLTNEAAGADINPHLGPRAVTALLWHFSRPTDLVLDDEDGDAQ